MAGIGGTKCSASAEHSTIHAQQVLDASQKAERLRVRELLSYFQPPSPTHPECKPQLAADTSLTAFAQLSAFKLNCQRSFISLMDHEHQYIIAEATRTLSLESEDIYDGEDEALYLGSTSLDLVWGVSPNTIKVFTTTDGSLDISEPYVKATKDYYVMSDLLKVEGFENRPYIAKWPHIRYFAEVPIKSPSGLTIGTLCVVDNKPRDGLDMRGIKSLNEVAGAVMDHLELIVSRVQRKRAERMIQGLGLFVEGSGSVRQRWSEFAQDSRVVEPNLKNLSLDEQIEREFGPESPQVSFCMDTTRMDTTRIDTTRIDTTRIDTTRIAPTVNNDCVGGSYNEDFCKMAEPSSPAIGPDTTSVHASSDIQRSHVEDYIRDTRSTVGSTLVSESGGFSDLDKSTSPTQPSLCEQKEPIGHKGSIGLKNSMEDSTSPTDTPSDAYTALEEMLFRATNLIREAVALDGVVFFDPRFTADVSEHEESGSTSVVHSRFQSINSFEVSINTPITRSSSPTHGRQSRVLACSTRTQANINDISSCPVNLSERRLQRIINKFPRGGVFQFDAEGLISYNEYEYHWHDRIPSQGKSKLSIRTPTERSKAQEGSRVVDSEDIAELTRLLPRVSSLILFPLWDSHNDRWFAYNLAWTTDPTRVFYREDYTYLASFGNSIMAEMSLLNTMAADRAKADFISSISHELRSPLHGVLASAELLKERTADSVSYDIINVIESCGSTLLDTMDNLLTFAKINNVVKKPQDEEGTRAERLSPQTFSGTTSEVDLALLTEEVMDTNLAGHHSRRMSEAPAVWEIQRQSGDPLPMRPLTVICDIEYQDSWVFNGDPGALKRILMNLVGNSLKYTTSGFIHVRLWLEEAAHPETRISDPAVCLSVEDSGIGISQDYLDNHLFTPFVQENSLCPGTGLGLSIVRQLVNSMDGKIDVVSEVGSGTSFKVTFWLERPPSALFSGAAPPSLRSLPKLPHLKLSVVGLDTYPDIQDAPTGILDATAKCGLLLKSSLGQLATETFGMELVTCTSLDSDVADILVTTEELLQQTRPTSKTRRSPVIVLCTDMAPDYRSVTDKNGPVIYLSQPFGPRKFSKALASCLSCLQGTAQPKDTVEETLLPSTTTSKSKASSKVTVLPVPTPGQDVPAMLQESIPDSPIATKPWPKILLVEDNTINLKILVMLVAKLGYTFDTATDGLQALNTYKSNSGAYDIIFMDIQMPVMDGMQASRHIREYEEEEGMAPTTIVALTGMGSTGVKDLAREMGIDLLLTKPVPMKVLRGILRELIPREERWRKEDRAV